MPVGKTSSGILLLAEVLTRIASKPLGSSTIHSLAGFFNERLVSRNISPATWLTFQSSWLENFLSFYSSLLLSMAFLFPIRTIPFHLYFNVMGSALIVQSLLELCWCHCGNGYIWCYQAPVIPKLNLLGENTWTIFILYFSQTPSYKSPWDWNMNNAHTHKYWAEIQPFI